MSELDHIKFRISRSQLDANGHYKQACVYAIGGTLTGDAVYQKLLVDIIAHALTLTVGIEVVDSERFTYTFPFKLV